MIKHWIPSDLATLRRLRERFLTGTAGAADYWRSTGDLELYDTTFAERIGWKWDAVLSELALRGWRPRSQRVLDWGCGSGVAHRRVLAAWPHLTTLALHDRSPLARRFSAERARVDFPQVQLDPRASIGGPETLLLVSHVINELSDGELDQLLHTARGVTEVVWVEAGTHVDSRRLIEVRERLIGEFTAIAPCTHQNACGLLTAQNAPHWCHHFAAAPSSIFQDARWAEFGKEMGIDLRRVPYSFLVLSRRPAVLPEGYSRVIGEAREGKGFTRVLSCQASGVADLMLQKRDAPDIYRAFHKRTNAPVYRWTMDQGKIVDGEPLENLAEPQVAPGETMP